MDLLLWRKRLWHLRHGGFSALQEFEARQVENTGVARVLQPRRLTSKGRIKISFDEWPLPDVDSWRGRRDLAAGIIADDFTLSALGYEWKQVELDPKAWRTQLDTENLDLLFVESAWHGNQDRWQYQITSSKGPSQTLKALVAECQKRCIPTIFWNKEDPAHFEDFIESARIFDWVFTTDEDRVDRYRERLGHDRVGVMSFAAQPAIHNPIVPIGMTSQHRRSVAFAGTYFRDKYPERGKQMEILLGGALDAQRKLRYPLDIFSRFRDVSEAYQFPEPYYGHVRGELNYQQMLTANRSYAAILNVNSVVDSSSMCARRIFEVSACGTPVISAISRAVETFFRPDEVIQVATREEASRWIRALDRSPELRDRMVHLAQRRIWQKHTFEHRINSVLQKIGFTERVTTMPSATAMISTNRPHQLSHVLGQMAQQKDVDLQVVILTHGFEPEKAIVDASKDSGMEINWVVGDSGWTLGQCYNRIIECSDGDVIAKIDDDDLYGQNYLFDQIAALKYSNAELVGKGAHYLHLADQNALCLRFPTLEFSWASFVAGPTFVGWKSTFEEIPFRSRTTGEDSQFLLDVRQVGGKVFSSDRFGFIQRRLATQEHTWRIPNEEILAASHLTTFGEGNEHVFF
ncbi:glycosyltransferase family protein [Schaalia vaccimaxillae]|uniref:glycosyltransferase family protein n=1 Tax=Schaalia vaccimaxillae TaxID=183916 RepID=UPI0003B56180|nr:glycosyltransferase [Schaalia vaccimaxillae]